jgi:hypothetical protein
MKKIIFTLIMAVFAGAVIFAAESVTLNPTADGFVKQADDTYVGTFENMELSSYVNFVREIFLDFDLTDVTFTPEHATLKLYVNSYSNTNPVIIAAYAKTGNAISESLTFTTRPTTNQYKTTDVHTSQDSVGKWLSFDFADFIKAQDFSVNKLVYFRIAILYPPTTSSTSPLIGIGSIESSNKPQLILEDAPVPGVYEVPYSVINSVTSNRAFAVARNPVNAFSGAGMLPDMCHNLTADNVAWTNSTGPFPISLTVKLNEAINIKKLHIWNLNWTAYITRGVKNMDIYISTSTDDLSAVTDFTDVRWTKVSATGLSLTQATGLVTYTGEDVAVTNSVNARWLALNIINNYGGSTSYTGLSEVKIYKEIVDPGPSTAINDCVNSGISVFSVGDELIVKNLSSGSQVQLFNMQGQLTHNEFAKASDMIFNVPSGIYIVRVNGLSLKAVHK